MKHNIFSIMAVLALFTPVAAGAQQRLQTIPETVQEISIEGKQKLRIVAGDETRLETTSDKNSIGTMRSRGTKLVVNSDGAEVTLRLAPWRSIRLHAEDYATLEFSGSFDKRENLVIETEDYAQAFFLGDTNDTVRAVTLILRAEDFSRITSNIIFQQYNYELSPADFSCIVLAGLDQMHIEDGGVRSHAISLSDHGKIYRGRCTDGGTVYATEYPEDDDLASRVTVDATDRAVDFARDIASGVQSQEKVRSAHPWHTDLELAFGWHNWGDQIGDGFSGVDGAAGINTTLNNWQLAVNIPFVNTRSFAIKAGLGLEWDKYKFVTPEVNFDATATPLVFVAGAQTDAKSWLKTCYVTIPVKMEFGNPKRWHFSLSAIGGLAWTGDNSGLRRRYYTASTNNTVKDYGINRYINPWKLDVRAALQYKGLGFYVQTSMLSALKDGCHELYPIKFGIIL